MGAEEVRSWKTESTYQIVVMHLDFGERKTSYYNTSLATAVCVNLNKVLDLFRRIFFCRIIVTTPSLSYCLGNYGLHFCYMLCLT